MIARAKRPDPYKVVGALCKRKLSYFVREFWDVVVPNRLVWNWHMQVLCDEIQAADERVFKRQPKEHDLIFNVPPGTSKTKILSIMSTAWEFARMPEIKVFVGSYADSAILGISDEIRLIMQSEKYRRCFPLTVVRSDRNSIHNFKTSANGEFYAFTVGGTLTSKHADILKIDDPINPKKAASEVELASTNTFFDQTLPTRKVDKKVTPTYLVMQRLDENDPTGHMLSKKKGAGIRRISLPAMLPGEVLPKEYEAYYRGGLLDPVRLDHAVLADMKLDLGSYAFSGQMQQDPAPKTGAIWGKWFVAIDDSVFPKLSSMVKVGTDWDTAFTEKDENAASAYITAGEINHKMFIDDLGWVYKEFPELIKFMKLKRRPHYIEAKASGKSAKQVLVKNGIPAIEVEVMGGSDKVARARNATPYAEAGMVFIRKSLIDKLYNDSEQGILKFPRSKKKDLADVLAQAIQRIFKGSIISANGGSSDSVLDGITPA